jgi:glycosyltransferase involved in cell wall biosynthesis
VNLLIISNMPHYRRPDGVLVGWGPTVTEIDHLATRFERVVHIATFHDGDAPSSFLPYHKGRVRLVPMKPTGGDRLRDKLGVLWASPIYIATMLRELRSADVVHLRCPANLPMLGAALLPFVRRPAARWIKYAGNWKPSRRDSMAFSAQRWFLARTWHRGVVTVNGVWPDQPSHIRSFYNPCLSTAEVTTARAATEDKKLVLPIRLLFAGRLEEAKGPQTTLEALNLLHRQGISAHLDLVGDGPSREALRDLAAARGIEDSVTFHGWVPRPAMGALYTTAHVLLLPSTSEGWPKVLSEGMAYGVVPIASSVGAIPEYFARFELGHSIDNTSPASFADAVASYVRDPATWKLHSRRGLIAVSRFSYESYLDDVDALLAEMNQTSGRFGCNTSGAP